MTWGKLLAAISIVGAAAAVPVGYFAWQRHHPAKHAGSAPAVIAAKPIEPGADAGSPGAIAGARAGRAAGREGRRCRTSGSAGVATGVRRAAGA